MPNPSHDRLRSLFDAALELPAEERAAMLRRECADDTALERRLQVILAAAEDDVFLGAPTGGPLGADAVAEGTKPSVLREGPGTMLGPYKLLEQIGEGGFGVVFKAVQERPVARQVALKIIKLGMDTHQVVARFEQERQALALMEHPNIARVIDAGATETGRPYFVMELVNGEPIVAYCDRHQLSISQRLELFAQVCNAVQHAHGKGIIHRDIKPSNILVATHDDRPLVKVIDFGIAKATSAKLTEKTLFTAHQQVIGTLQYMSPEQAQGSLDIDTRTDVYALGVVLYELLTGSTPLDAKTIGAGLYDEIQRIIQEVEPPKPSTRLSQFAEQLATLAAQRKIAPGRLSLLMRGDLDWIVMKALEKDRGRRYASSGSLAEDVQRYLAGEAVLAAPPSAVYRVRKFVRRHRFGVAATAVLTATLLAGLGGTWRGMLEARRERAEAQRQTVRADAEREEADVQRAAAVEASTQLARVVDFQSRMLSRVPPFEMGRDLALDLSARVEEAQAELDLDEEQRAEARTRFDALLGGISMTDAARRVIDLNVLTPASESIVAEFGNEPFTSAALHATLAETYRTLGIFDKAFEQARSELALREEYQGADHPEALHARVLVGELQYQLGEIDEAERTMGSVLVEAERVLGPEHIDTLHARLCIGVFYMERGRDGEALTSFTKLLGVMEDVLGVDAHEVAVVLANTGRALMNLGRKEEAIVPLERALDIRRRVFGSEDTETLHAQQSLAKAYESQRRFEDAGRLHLEAIESLERILGANHPATIDAIAKLAGMYKAQNRFEDAELHARLALARLRLALGDGHPRTIDAMSEVGVICTMLGRHAEAEPLLAEALKWSTEVYGPDSTKTMGRLNNLAVAYWYQGDFGRVEPLFARALEFNRRTHGENDPKTAFAMLNMSIVMHRLGRLDEERPFLEQALAINLENFGEEHEQTLRTKVALAVLAFDTGELDEAEARFVELIEVQGRVLGEDSPNTIESRANLASVYLQLERFDEAEALMHEVLELRRQVIGESNHATVNALRELVNLYAVTDRLDEARPLLEELIAERKRAADAPDATPNALADAALTLLEAPIAALRDLDRGLEYARRANELTNAEQSRYLDIVARALHATGDVQGAREAWRSALAVLPAKAPERAAMEERLETLEREQEW